MCASTYYPQLACVSRSSLTSLHMRCDFPRSALIVHLESSCVRLHISVRAFSGGLEVLLRSLALLPRLSYPRDLSLGLCLYLGRPAYHLLDIVEFLLLCLVYYLTRIGYMYHITLLSVLHVWSSAAYRHLSHSIRLNYFVAHIS